MNKKIVIANIILWSVVAFLALGSFIALSMNYSLEFGRFNIFNLNTEFQSELFGKEIGDLNIVKEVTISDPINDVTVDWISGSVTLRKSENQQIKIVEKSKRNVSEDKLLSYKLNNSKLTIIQYKSKKIMDFPSNTNIPTCHLELYLPEKIYEKLTLSTISADIQLEEFSGLQANILNIDSVSGDLNMDECFSESFQFSSISGNLISSNLEATKFVAETTSGDINLKGNITKEINLSSVSGNAEIEMNQVSEVLNFNSVSGDLKLHIPENDGFMVNYNKLSGDFNSDFACSKNGENYTYKNGNSKIYFDAISGDLIIRKID